ncbi:MAG: hypothetical protein AAF645_12960 [Myxococcota bacterium]
MPFHDRFTSATRATYSLRAFILAAFLAQACGGGSDPGEACEAPGSTETVACGSCGTLERFCSAGGVWVPGVCDEPVDACEPGATEDRTCGNCGTQRARCNASCEWEPEGVCEGGGLCAPGERSQSAEGCGSGESREVLCSDACEFEPAGDCTSNECDSPGASETVACGNCGTTTRFCTSTGVWEFGICDEAPDACEPGTMQLEPCGNCGMRENRCLTSCELEAGECMAEGVCAPGALMTTSDGCAAGQERTLRCTDGCAFEEVDGCVGPTECSPACDAGERCDAGTCRCGSGPACTGRDMCIEGRCEAPRPDPGPAVIWAHSRSELERFDPLTRTTRIVGSFWSRTESAPGMTDLAVRSDGAVFTVSNDGVFEVNVDTAEVTRVVDLTLANVGMGFVAAEPGAAEDLVITTRDPSAIYRVNLDGGPETLVLSIGDGCIPSGDVISVLDVGTYITLFCDDDPTQDYLAVVDFDAGRITRVGPTGFERVWGMGYWGGVLFGFTDFGEAIVLNMDTGRGTLLFEREPFTGGYWGAGSNANAPIR